MIAPHAIGVLRDAFGRSESCECCGVDHLLVATAEQWVAETADTPDLRDGFLMAASGLRRDHRLSFCCNCLCIRPLPH